MNLNNFSEYIKCQQELEVERERGCSQGTVPMTVALRISWTVGTSVTVGRVLQQQVLSICRATCISEMARPYVLLEPYSLVVMWRSLEGPSNPITFIALKEETLLSVEIHPKMMQTEDQKRLLGMIVLGTLPSVGLSKRFLQVLFNFY
jgi:hypothetical protein